MPRIEIIETKGLGDRTYVATDGEVAVVVDPQRDIDRVLATLGRSGVRLTHVLETHIHNDYVTGGLELARTCGADYVLSGSEEVAFERHPIHDGETVRTGRLTLTALHTPGHTPNHLSYLLRDADEPDAAVFTGGSMLYGTTGRTDLLGKQQTDRLTRQQFHSVRRLGGQLHPATRVLPTHGFGSFCSATPGGGDDSTIGHERQVNPALTLPEQAYVDSLLAGLDAYPAYYTRMAPINRAGPAPVDLSLPARVDPEALASRIAHGEWIVDLRDRQAFAAGHLPGSLGFEVSAHFVTYFGWLYRWDRPLTLLGESVQQVATARRELARIGIDVLAGMATGDIADLAGEQALSRYAVSTFAGLAQVRARARAGSPAGGGPVVLDARRDDERARSGVRGSLHIPLHELPDRMDEVPLGEVWVYCSSGYRASIAASMLDRPSRSVTLIDDDFEAAERVGLVEEHSRSGSSDEAAGATPAGSLH